MRDKGIHGTEPLRRPVRFNLHEVRRLLSGTLNTGGDQAGRLVFLRCERLRANHRVCEAGADATVLMSQGNCEGVPTHMVPGEVHMSDTPSGLHPIILRTIRLAAIPILLKRRTKTN